MKKPTPGIYWFSNKYFAIREDTGKAFVVDVYEMRPSEGYTTKETRTITHNVWANTLPYSSSIPLDRDSMQGFILAIFGEDF
jgi:hypothetical protein